MSETGELLIKAAKEDDVRTLEELISKGGDVQYANEEGFTALHWAAGLSAAAACEVLLAHKADIEARANKGSTALHYAAANSAEACEVLLAHKADIEAQDNDGSTALHYAAGNSAEACEVLLAHKADIKARDNDGRTALHYAAGNSAAACEVLLAHKADIRARTNKGSTALHIAACNSATAACEVLLAHKADIRARTNKGSTALHYAAANSAAACEVLLAHKADIEARNNNQQTPMHRACFWYNDASPSDSLKHLEVVIILIRHNADITCKDKDGKTPLDLLSASKRTIVQQEFENFTTVHKLMQQSRRPMDVVKICLCGDPAAGKSTLKRTLTKKLSLLTKIGRTFGRSKKREEVVSDDGHYDATPGIDVSQQSVPDAGKFVFWDCAGQREYAITHGMLLGAMAHSIFVVLYDLASPESKKSVIEYWLPFIRAVHMEEEAKPHVILVGTHLDKVRNQQGIRDGSDVLDEAKSRFQDTLDIDGANIVVDARDGDCQGMVKLKEILKKRREEIIKGKTVPKLCDKVQALIEPHRHTAVPVLGWGEYLQLVKTKYEGMDEGTLKLVTGYLHLQGEVYWAKFTEKEDQLIVNTQWFTTEIIGAAFAGDEFRRQFKPLPDQACYTLEELRNFFPPQMDTSRLLALLDDMDLVHVMTNDRYLLPGKLPLTSSELDAWETCGDYDLKGRSIKCLNDTDIFNPVIFPTLQKKILDKYPQLCKVWQSAALCTFGKVEVHIQLTKRKRAIQIVVKCPTAEDLREVSHEKLDEVFELLMSELFQKSKGTRVQIGYLSPNAMKQNKGLEEVLMSFSQEELVKAEEGSGGVIGVQAEDITQILSKGYDTMFLLKLGPQCRYDWLPVGAAKRCFPRLDKISDWGEDYRAVGLALGIPEDEINLLADSSSSRHESLTINIINKWCKDQKRIMSIGMLQNLLSRLSLFYNADALVSVDEVVEKYTSHLMNIEAPTGLTATSDVYTSHDADCSFSDDVTDELVRWRLALKRLKERFVCDLVTSGITSSLHYLPEHFCQVLEDRPLTQEQRQQKAENLLKELVHRKEDRWPKDFLQGLRETGQSPLANALEEEYQKVEEEEEARTKRFKDKRLGHRAFNKSIKHKEGPAATGTG